MPILPQLQDTPIIHTVMGAMNEGDIELIVLTATLHKAIEHGQLITV